MTSRSYCFTSFIPDNIYNEEDISPAEALAETFIDMLGSTPGVRYVIGQLERCPTTQKLHIQGYVEFDASRSMRWLKGQSNDDKSY